MKRLLGFRVWHGVVSVVAAAVLGALTNVVTDQFSWTLAMAVVGLVAVQVVLSVWQGQAGSPGSAGSAG